MIWDNEVLVMEALFDGLRYPEEDWHPGLRRMLVSICRGFCGLLLLKRSISLLLPAHFLPRMNVPTSFHPHPLPCLVTHRPELHHSPSPILCQIDHSYCGVTLFRGGPLPMIPSAKDLSILLVLPAHSVQVCPY